MRIVTPVLPVVRSAWEPWELRGRHHVGYRARGFSRSCPPHLPSCFWFSSASPFPTAPRGILWVSGPGRKGHTWTLHGSLLKGGEGHELSPRDSCGPAGPRESSWAPGSLGLCASPTVGWVSQDFPSPGFLPSPGQRARLRFCCPPPH